MAQWDAHLASGIGLYIIINLVSFKWRKTDKKKQTKKSLSLLVNNYGNYENLKFDLANVIS